MNYYEIYDSDNNLVFTGNHNEVCEQFNLEMNSLYAYYCRGSKIAGEYTVKRIIYETEKEKVKRVLTEREKTIDYIVRHLEYYGNVYVKKDPSEYLDELEKLGYKCKIDEYQTIDDVEIIVSETSKALRKRKRKYTTDYVLTRLK